LRGKCWSEPNKGEDQQGDGEHTQQRNDGLEHDGLPLLQVSLVVSGGGLSYHTNAVSAVNAVNAVSAVNAVFGDPASHTDRIEST
jgi:hypothetical protein